MKRHPWATYCGLLIFAYLAPLFFSFAHHDQYRHFRIPESEKLSCENDTQYRGLFYDLGRPVTALLECWQFMTTQSRSDLTFHRVITLVVIAALFTLLALIFRRQLNIEQHSSYGLALAICLLPGFLDLFVMSNYAVVLGLLVSAGAFFLLTFGTWGYVGAFILLLVSLFTYPTSAFLFLSLSGGKFIFTKERLSIARRQLGFEFLMMLLGSGVFSAGVKFVLHPIVRYDDRDIRGSYVFRISTDVVERLNYYAEGFRWALNFWNIYSLRTIATAVFAMMIWLAYRYLKTKKYERFAKSKVIIATLTPFAVFSPIGLSNMNEILYRTIIALTASLLIALYWLISQNVKLKPVWVLAMGLIIAMISGFNLGMAAWNYSIEFDHLVSQIKSRDLLKHRILVVKNVERPDSTLGINGLPTVSDEFNINTTVYNREENTFIMRAALVEAGGDPRIHVYLCVSPEDCARAEQIIQTMPFVYVVVKQYDVTGFPSHYPIIDMEQFSR